MTPKEQHAFIAELCDNVRDNLLRHQYPENWTLFGRTYLAETLLDVSDNLARHLADIGAARLVGPAVLPVLVD